MVKPHSGERVKFFNPGGDTHVVNMISTIHDSTMVDVPWRKEEVKKKPICIFQYMFLKGVDRADQ